MICRYADTCSEMPCTKLPTDQTMEALNVTKKGTQEYYGYAHLEASCPSQQTSVQSNLPKYLLTEQAPRVLRLKHSMRF